MGWALVVIATASLVAMSFHAVEGSWKTDVVEFMHVGGKVMCQDCTKGWSQWAHGATPLKGCKVAITCMDARRRVVYHVSDETDDGGEFEMPVSSHVNGREIDPRACSVRLVSSPDPACGVATNFGGGRSGLKLRRPSHVYPDRLKYTVGPFYFTSPMCDEPDTSGSGDGKGY